MDGKLCLRMWALLCDRGDDTRARSVLKTTMLAGGALLVSACSQSGVGSEPEACFSLTKQPELTFAEDDTTASECVSQLPTMSDRHQAAFAREYASTFLGRLSLEELRVLADTTRGDAALIFSTMASRNLVSEGKDEDKAQVLDLLKRAQSTDNRHAESILHRILGNFEFYAQEYEEGLKHYNRSLAVANETGMAGFVPHVLLGMGAMSDGLGDPEKSLEYNRRALQSADILSSRGLRVACQNVTVSAQNVEFISDEALAARIADAKQLGEDTFANCLTHGEIGRAIRRADADTAGTKATELLQDITGTRLEVIRPKILHALGQQKYQDGEFVEALDLIEQALDAFRKDSDLASQFAATTSIGHVLADLGDYDRALETYIRSGELLTRAKVNSLVAAATVEANIAWTLAMQGKHDEALVKYREAQVMMEPKPEDALIGFVNYHYAKSLFETGELDGAIRMAQAAIPPTLERRNPLEAAAIYSWIASRQLERGDFADAQSSLAAANEIVNRDDVVRDSLTGDPTYRYWDADYHSNMANVLEKMGRPVEALGHSKRALEISYSRFETEQLEAAANAELKFDLWERDQTIALNARETELQELRLERTMVMSFVALALALLAGLAAFFAYYSYRMQRRVAKLSSVVMAEEHHRTKNALQMASSLTRQFERDAEIQGADMREIRQRLKTMALLHEHLRSADGEIAVDACAFISELAAQVSEGMAPPGVSIETECNGISLAPGTATSLGLILCEMMINACKHAFPDEEGKQNSHAGHNGLIIVRLEAGGSRAWASVSDNGIGNSSAPSSTNGTGTQLIEDLAAQIGASAHFTQTAEGSTWNIKRIPFIRLLTPEPREKETT